MSIHESFTMGEGKRRIKTFLFSFLFMISTIYGIKKYLIIGKIL